MKKRKAIIFIDGNNWYHTLKDIIKPSKVDLNLLANFICEHFDLELLEIRYYNSVPDISDSKKVYYKHQEFLTNLRKKSIIVKTRKLKKVSKKNIKVEKGIDVMITVDMIQRTIIDDACDCCVLVSGDADFIPAMQILKEKGYEAISCSVPDGHASELKEGKFRYLILKKKDLEDLST